MREIAVMKDSSRKLVDAVRSLVCDTPHANGVFKSEDIDMVVQYVKSMERHSARAVEFAEEIEKFFNRK